MIPDADDARLRELLRDLPKAEAGEDFTRAVLARLAEQDVPARPSRPWGRELGWAFAALAVFAAGLLVVLAMRTAAPGSDGTFSAAERTERIEALEKERARLLSELRELKGQMREAQPVLYLGGNDDVALVLDTSEIDLGTAGAARARPAAYGPL